MSHARIAKLSIHAAIAAAALASPALAAPPGSGWDLVMADEFSGTSLDTHKWNYNYSWGRTHNHRAFMRESQVIVSNGTLNLQAINQRDPAAGSGIWREDFGWQSFDYTSGAINSQGKFNFTGGYVEARMKMDDTMGSWPAFWMLQNGWPPEIDIMEFPRSANNSATQRWTNYHYTNANNAHASYGWQDSGPNLTTEFHNYGVAWSPTAMTFYFDGVAKHTITDAAAIADAQGMYMILNHAIGGWAGSPDASSTFPVDFETDWVRVWQQRPAGSVITSAWNVAGSGSWDSAAAWTGIVPKHSGQRVRFGRTAAATSTVTWDWYRTIGGLSFDGDRDGSTQYIIGAAGGNSALQLAGSAGANAFIEATGYSVQAQTINAKLELYNNVDIRNYMASGMPIALNGEIVGTGQLSIDGTGLVILNNINSYTGDTIIDPGTQGAATVRAVRSRALGTGVVRIGPSGNLTLARLELTNNTELPNQIELHGRNNSTAGIVGISRDNTLAGTVNLQVGGGSYLIESGFGLLMLSGSAPGANGIALQSAAGGSRTVTFGGAGTGLISGIIQNGAASDLSLVKTGTGLLVLSNTNTHTGQTRVEAGTLQLTGTIANSSGLVVGTPGGTTAAKAIIAKRQQIKNLTVNGVGNVELKLSGSTTPAANTLTIASDAGITFESASSRLNLTDNGLILDPSAVSTDFAATLRSQIAAGQIYSSLDTPTDNRRIGYRNAIAGGEMFMGSTADESAILVRMTLGGDGNLDGTVNFADLVSLAQSYNATDRGWQNGDFNYDGSVNFADLVVLAQNYNQNLSGAAAAIVGESFAADYALAVSMVPEPTSLAAAGAAASILLRRRRA